MFRPCPYAAILLIIFLLVINGAAGYKQNVFSASDTSNNWPHKNDLYVYLKSLRRIVQFASEHLNDVDLNFAFGLFLMNVNLKKVLQENKIHEPKTLSYIKLLLSKNKTLLDFFYDMVRKDGGSNENDMYKTIVSLMSNETQWIKNIGQFKSVLLIKPGELRHEVNLPWPKYITQVVDLDSCVPSPTESDMCMISLAVNKIKNSHNARCELDEPCYDMLTNGTDYGYAIAHRLLFLLHARFSRGCSIFSYKQDKRQVNYLCSKMYQEAEYIAKNAYGIVDLILEQMTICSMAGHAQFLKRHWISNILRFQTAYGCFGVALLESDVPPRTVERYPRSWQMVKHMDHNIMGGQCNGHVTSVAAATLATAIRFIVQVYY